MKENRGKNVAVEASWPDAHLSRMKPPRTKEEAVFYLDNNGW